MKRYALITGFCLLLAFLVFGGALWHGFSMIDDPYLISQNLFVRGLSVENLRYVFTHFDPELYMPLTFVSYQLDYVIGALNPTIFHATNILLHGINGALLIALLWLLFRNRTAAILGGLIFLVHPLNTEAVVWAAGRKDLLSTGLFLGALIAYVIHISDWGAGVPTRGRSWYWLSIGLFLLALMSKAMVMTFPAILILLLPVIGKRKVTLRSIISLGPYILLSIIFGAIALIGKERIVQSSTLTQTILMAGKSTVFYLQKIFWPTGLTPLYPYHNPIVISSPDFYIPLIVLGIIAVAAIVSLKWTKWIAVGLAFFLITLSPTFLNFHKGTVAFFAVDRYAYLPMIGIVILIAGCMEQMSSGKRLAVSDKHVAIFVGIFIVILASLSLIQTTTWSSDETLLTRSLLLYPDSIPARLSLSVIYRQEGRVNDERSVLESGLTYRDDVAYRTGLGSIFAREGKTDEARKEYELGQKLDPSNPEPLFFLGSLEEQLNHPDKALELYKQAIALDDSYVAAYINAGAILLDRGDLTQAETMFRTALHWNPSTMEANYNLFDVLERQKKPEEGFPFLVRAYQLNPDDPDIGLSYAYRLIDQKETKEADAILNHLLFIDPGNRAAQRLKSRAK